MAAVCRVGGESSNSGIRFPRHLAPEFECQCHFHVFLYFSICSALCMLSLFVLFFVGLYDLSGSVFIFAGVPSSYVYFYWVHGTSRVLYTSYSFWVGSP